MTMGISIAIVIISGFAGWMVWQKRRGKMAVVPTSTDEIAPEDLAQRAFTRGNTCLFSGEVEEAIAAFQRALELNPHHPHAAKRLAEAEHRRTMQAKEATTVAA